MTLETWSLFCLTEAVLCFTPGPAVLLVVSMSLSRSGRAGLGASVGILTANCGYFLLSATGLGAILLASWNLFFTIKWLGAAYLIWIGTRMILWPSHEERSPEAADRRESPRGRRSSFWYGFLTQAANPKALVFFTALLPQFIDPGGDVVSQVAILAVSSIIIELLVLSIYVVACHRARRWAHAPRIAAPLQRLGGVLLVGAGARLAATRST